MTTGKYELVIKWASGQSTICGEMTDHQHGEICRILSPDYRAQPIQGGETVEVVAYGDKQQLNALKSECSASCAVWNAPGRNREPLMTVAQHQRILAASAGSADHVGVVFTMEALAPGGGVKSHASLNRDLPAGTKLYTHPADQVAEPDAELVALLVECQRLLSAEPHGILSGMADQAKRADWYSAMTPVRDRIDAKLAALLP